MFLYTSIGAAVAVIAGILRGTAQKGKIQAKLCRAVFRCSWHCDQPDSVLPFLRKSAPAFELIPKIRLSFVCYLIKRGNKT